ncbi:MAG: GlsB/YeaQ/YmgE family stress response membrane protein [Actinophytocola sp.]|nr:GlsB/YeaQ/YmgE family stress response membrane protein [Actinophytocola sp.]
MTITGLISALIVGAVIGVAARLILPGKQPIGILLTILVGMAAALLGTWLTNRMGIGDAQGYDAFELIAQILLAVIGVGIVAGVLRGGRRSRV